MTHLQVINWADHSTPEGERAFSSTDFLLYAINEARANFSKSPVLIHCSAGTGRTGTLIAIYNIIRSLNALKIINQTIEFREFRMKPFFSVFNVVRKLREQRMSMVSSFSQYEFIYAFVLEWVKRNFELAV